MKAFDVHSECTQEHVRVQVAGEVDLATAPQVASRLAEHAPGPGGSVVLDLAEVGFIDSTGVHMLIAVSDEARRAGWTLTIAPSDAVRRILSLLALEDLLLSPQTSASEAPASQFAASA